MRVFCSVDLPVEEDGGEVSCLVTNSLGQGPACHTQIEEKRPGNQRVEIGRGLRLISFK